MRPRFTSAVVAAASVLLLVPATAQANHSWGGYHWARTSNPFTLKLGDNVDNNWQTWDLVYRRGFGGQGGILARFEAAAALTSPGLPQAHGRLDSTAGAR